MAVLIVFIGLCLFSGCASSHERKLYTRNGNVYGVTHGAFRNRWWNYYERGLSFADGEFYKEALADLKKASQQRTKDQRMARTYGMHFIDYFPHRELGIVYYRMGNLDTAKRELGLSLRYFPSAKARFYLDRVRKALIERQAKAVSPPRLTLNFKSHEVWTRQDPVIVSGVAEDDEYVSGITIGRIPIFLEGSQKRIPFRRSLTLTQGRHTIEVVARNLLGRVTKRRVVIHVDREGPMIAVDQIERDKALAGGQAVTISGSIYDKTGVSELVINGRRIPIKVKHEVFFSERFITDRNDLELVTKDRLGNQTTAHIPCLDSQPGMNSGTGGHNPKLVLLACADPDFSDYLVAGLFGPKDTHPPRIELRGWSDTQTVFLKNIYLEGQVSDESKIISLEVNGVPKLRRQGRSIFFSHLWDLKKGKNEILIEAEDEAGNKATKRISVLRKIPKALQISERLSLMVVPFEERGTGGKSNLSFQDNLIDSLVNQNRFRVVEREKLDIILKEQKLSRTKLVDKTTALKLGRLVAAQSIIAGRIIENHTGPKIA